MGYITIISKQGVFTTRTESLIIHVSRTLNSGKFKVVIKGWYDGYGKRMTFYFTSREAANAFAKSISDKIPTKMTMYQHHTIDARAVE